MVFAHFGLSGHAILNLACESFGNGKYEVELDLCPNFNSQVLLNKIVRSKKDFPKKQISTIIAEFVPKSVASYILFKCGISNGAIADKRNNEIIDIVECIKSLKFEVKKFGGYDMAYVSSGGVLTSEINPKTMESKKHRNVYVIGEALDVFGLCGGFNLQIAFSTAYSAACAFQKFRRIAKL